MADANPSSSTIEQDRFVTMRFGGKAANNLARRSSVIFFSKKSMPSSTVNCGRWNLSVLDASPGNSVNMNRLDKIGNITGYFFGKSLHWTRRMLRIPHAPSCCHSIYSKPMKQTKAKNFDTPDEGLCRLQLPRTQIMSPTNKEEETFLDSKLKRKRTHMIDKYDRILAWGAPAYWFNPHPFDQVGHQFE